MERNILGGTVRWFIENHAELPELLRKKTIECRHVTPSESEIKSWRKSFPKLASVLDEETLANLHITFEFSPPAVGKKERVDAIIIGTNDEGKNSVLVIENKNWPDGGILHHPASDMVTVGTEEKRHPSVQAESYARQLRHYHEAITGRPDESIVRACAFLPFTKDKSHTWLNDSKFRQVLETTPIFYASCHDAFRRFLSTIFSDEPSAHFIAEFEDAKYLPSPSLLDLAKGIFNHDERFRLSDEQHRAFQAIALAIEDAAINKDSSKKVFVIKGGPGTGKSLVGLKLLGDYASRLGNRVLYAAGNASFEVNLAGSLSLAAKQKQVPDEFDFDSLFTNFRAFGDTLPNNMDLIICDEAQRLQPDSSTQYRKVKVLIEQSQEIIQAAKVSVFLMDEYQKVRARDVGTAERIKETASFLKADYKEFDLVSQFRCSQSERYVASVNQVFDMQGLEDIDAPSTKFDFRVMASPQEMEQLLLERMDQGSCCRMIAGYCWPWTKTSKKSEPLSSDVTIGEWQRPWNRADNSGGKSHRRTNFGWATNDDRFQEVGCIHTSHGIEFDYVGVLLGGDLIFRQGKGWTCEKSRIHDRGFKSGISKDPTEMTKLLKNIYRTLLTRGKFGCFIYSTDPETAAYLESQIVA